MIIPKKITDQSSSSNHKTSKSDESDPKKFALNDIMANLKKQDEALKKRSVPVVSKAVETAKTFVKQNLNSSKMPNFEKFKGVAIHEQSAEESTSPNVARHMSGVLEVLSNDNSSLSSLEAS